MIIITKKEKLVYEEIKYLAPQFGDGIPEKMVKREIDIPEHDYYEILSNLESKGLISRANGRVNVKKFEDELKIVEDQREVKIEELNQIEKDAIRIIKGMVEDGLIPRYTLEGEFLYGRLKLSNLQVYRLLLALEGKGLIKKVSLKDGEYYKIQVN